MTLGNFRDLTYKNPFYDFGYENSIKDVVREIESAPKDSFVLGSVEFKGFVFQILECTWSNQGMAMRVMVPDRDSRKPIILRFNVAWWAETEEQIAENLRRATSQIVAHEMAELILLRGVRDDPHAPKLEFTFTI